ncbi:unnamed protein product [Cyprideis torosa]|uniref:Uncharacterized protein n=1 Tax=Cyprideis torosa TaxID=163714 RepID=A0A7R8WCA1_9CRUS|nr:unnamed protein product [Cyprideis torosa]CAG0888247.1 unnamed protein product [Cyprideis torosa]
MSSNKLSRFLDDVGKKIQIRNETFRQCVAEFAGMFVLVFIGDCSVAQADIFKDESGGSFFVINICYAIAVVFGLLVCAGVSGGHMNPAVTLAMGVFGELPWFKVPLYMLSQYAGGFVAAAMVYVTYRETLIHKYGDNRFDVKYAGIFTTFPREHMTGAAGFLDQVIGTAVLLLMVCAIVDKRNMKVPEYLIPAYAGLGVAGIGMSLGYQCGYPINPARDFGPRLFTFVGGWGSAVFTAYNYWAWIPMVACHIGGVLGVVIYKVFIQNHWPPLYEVTAQTQMQNQLAMDQIPLKRELTEP